MTYLNTFPKELSNRSRQECNEIAERLSSLFQAKLKQQHINEDLSAQLKAIYIPLAATLYETTKRQNRTLVVGINGAQGSGKSTLCTLLELILHEGFDLKATSLSIDDIYCTQEERLTASQTIHPLFATRGVPGTHDIALGMNLLDRLTARGPSVEVTIPLFDKAIDDRSTPELWRKVQTPFDIIFLEGWCVGANPQKATELTKPINLLEANEDQEMIWRNHVNRELGDNYAALFSRLDLLIMLEIPGIECVFEWRGLQEDKLKRQSDEQSAGLMDTKELHRFIMHYERLTRHMLEEMPLRADLVLRLNRKHQIDGIRVNHDH